MWLRLAGRSECPRGSRRWSCSYSGALGPRPLFVARPLSKVERGRRDGRVLRRLIAESVCASRDARAASPAATGLCVGLARGGEPPAGACELRWERGCLREGVARRQGCRRNRVGMSAPGGDLPAVGGELASDRDRDDPAGFVAGVFELAPAGVESALRAPGDVDDLGCLPALAALERFTDRGPAAVVVGRLDQQPPGVGGAGLGDRSQPPLRAGGVLGGDDPEVGGELVGMIEALPFADLGAQPERGQRVDPAQASEPGDRVRARGAERELGRGRPRPGRGGRSARRARAGSRPASPGRRDRRTAPRSATSGACATTSHRGPSQ